MNASAGRIRLFRDGDELLNLIWPGIIFILLLALVFYQNGKPIDDPTSNLLLFVAGTAFLNIVHNAFSFFIVGYFPEFRAWVAELSTSERVFLFSKWALIFLALGAYFLWLHPFVQRNKRASVLLILTAVTIDFVAHYHHAIKQIQGLSMAYTLKQDASGDDRMRSDACQRRERLLFSLLLIVSLAASYQMLSNHHQLRWLTLLVSLFCCLGLAVNSSLYPQASRSNRTLFLLRLFFFPLALTNPIFRLGMPSVHGVEYAFVFRKMLGNSQLPQVRKNVLLWNTFIPLSTVVGLLTITRMWRGYGYELRERFPDYSQLILLLAAFSMAINFMHFYLDRQIFRMRNPLARKHIGPLLIRDGQLPTAPSEIQGFESAS